MVRQPWCLYSTTHCRGKECTSTPMPGVVLEKRSPLKELVPIEAVASPSKIKGKSKEEEMDEGTIEKRITAMTPLLLLLLLLLIVVTG
jgi:hypothetical protein